MLINQEKYFFSLYPLFPETLSQLQLISPAPRTVKMLSESDAAFPADLSETLALLRNTLTLIPFPVFLQICFQMTF